MTGNDDAKGQIADLVLSVYQIHEAVLAQTGGIPGLRDAAMLHAAVARPFATFGGEPLYPSDLEKAAALFHSLIKSHPFLDGTKRTAFLAALWLLRLYGDTIPARLPHDEVVKFCVEVAEENSPPERPPRTVSEIAAWFGELISQASTS